MPVDSPKNPGDRAYGHGDTVTLDIGAVPDSELVNGELPEGYFVDLDGTGGVTRPGDGTDTGDYASTGNFEAVLKYPVDPAVDDEAVVQLRGCVRAAESGHGHDVVRADFGDGSELIVLR